VLDAAQPHRSLRAQELADLLGGEAGIQAITQIANVTGNNNVTTQIGGTGNTASVPQG
jgi:hypothetical protein